MENERLRKFGKFELDTRRKVLWHDGETVPMALKELELLCVLVENHGQLLTKNELMDKVWADSFVGENNLSRHIYLLRKTLKNIGGGDQLIENVARRGYRFTGEIEENSNHKLIIEKYTLTQTLVEEVDDSREKKALQPIRTSRSYWIPIVALVSIMALFAIYYFSNKAETKPSNQIKTIAVLPLKSYEAKLQDETLPIRIADAVITRLGSSEKIIVRPTNAVTQYAKTELNAVEIGKILQTEAVLDGRIQQENDKLRVTLQLINVTDGKQIWAGQIDGLGTQILSLQDEISQKVLLSLDSNGNKEINLAELPTKSSDAYEAYLQGRYYMSQLTMEGLNKSKDYFNKAIEIDPNFSEAHAGLASAEYYLYDHAFIAEDEQVVKAKKSLKRALELKPNSVEANTILAFIQWNYEWDWKNAETTYQKTIELSPNNSNARQSYATLLNRLGRYQESDIQIRKAVELNPTNLMGNVYIGVNYFSQKNYEFAIKQFQKAIEISPKFVAGHWWLSRALWLAGRKQEAVQEIFLALEYDGETGKKISGKLKKNIENKTPEDVLKELIAEWQKNELVTPHTFAYMNILLGDKPKALDWLEKSYENRHPWTTWLKSAPEFQMLTGEPRYQELLRKMNLD